MSFNPRESESAILDSPDKPDERRKIKIVLVGNPNVGKSLFFNHLSGGYVDVSNFPGTTVSVTKGNYKNFEVYDTPGIYGVSSFNDEERVARDIILEADIILNIVNSLYLERDLFLTQQLIDMGKKVSVFLNFTDEVKKRNLKIDYDKLSDFFGVEVIPCSAVDGYGFEKLDFAIENARVGKRLFNPQKYRNKPNYSGIPEAELLLIAEGDDIISDKYKIPVAGFDEREQIYIERRNAVNELVSNAEYVDSSKGRFFNLLGRLSIDPKYGFIVMLFILTMMYFFIGDLVAQRLVGFTEGEVGNKIFENNLKIFVGEFTPVEITAKILNEDDEVISSEKFDFPMGIDKNSPVYQNFKKLISDKNYSLSFHYSNWLYKLLFGEFGVISMTITYLLFLLLPLVIAFYFAMAFLEDSGYLPRLATMMDRSLNKLGLNGKAIIPIILGFGCVTMATITTRILGNEREKTIATAILQFVIPCSAQLAVITVLMASAGFVPLMIYVFVILSVLITLSTILNKFLQGSYSPLLLDLPMMQFPKFNNVMKKTYYRTLGFMKEAAVWFFVGALIVGLFDVTGLLKVFQDILAPVTVNWLKLPKEAATAFVMGVVRRDFGTAGLFEMSLAPMQITVAIITITLFVPCIASLMVMLSERGWKQGLIIWGATWVVAFTIGGLVAQVIV